jgi:hypothetical protein
MSSQNIRHEVFYGPLPYQPGYRTGRATGAPGREKETAENYERAEDIYHNLEQRRFIKAHTPSHLQREILNIAYPAYGEVPLIDASDHDFKGKRSRWALDYETACEDGQLATVQSMVSTRKHTPLFLHSGLTYAICAGQVELTISSPLAHPSRVVRRTTSYVHPAIQRSPSLMLWHSADGDRCLKSAANIGDFYTIIQRTLVLRNFRCN